MPLKRIVLIIMCTTLAVMVIMMGVLVGKVAPFFGALFGPDEPVQTDPPTTQTDPTTEPTTQPTVPPTTQPTVPPTTQPAHKHDFSSIKEDKKPTCEAAGYTIYICSCGETKLETTEPLEHSFGAGELNLPSCDKEGYTLLKCSVCGFEDRQDVQEKLGHDMKFVKEIKVTCEKQGYVEYKCARANCGEIEHKDIQDPTGHAWVKGETHDPSCTKEGYTEYTCSNNGCGEKKEDDKIPALGHSFGDWEIQTEPAAGKPGTEVRKCSVCEVTETRELELGILEEKGINTSADNACNHFIINVGSKDSAGKEVTVYSYEITDYSRVLTSGSFAYDPEKGLLVTVSGKDPYVLAPGNGKLTLDKDGKVTANAPAATDPGQSGGSEPTGSSDGE